MEKVKKSKEAIPEIRNPEDVFLILYFDAESSIQCPKCYSSIVSSIVFFKYFRHFQVPLENISINASKDAISYLQQIYSLQEKLYFEHKDLQKMYVIDKQIIDEFQSIINKNQIQSLKTTKNSTIYSIFEDGMSETSSGISLQQKYSHILENITNLKYHDLYILNASYNNGAIIQYFTLIKKFKEIFSSYEDLFNLFDVIYPLYNLGIPPFVLIENFKNSRFHIEFDFNLLNDSKFNLGHSLLQFTQLFECDLIPYSEVLNRSKQISIKTIEEKIGIHNEIQYKLFISFLNKVKFDNLQDLKQFSLLLDTLQDKELNLQTFIDKFFNQKNLECLSLLYNKLSDDQLLMLQTIIKSLYLYSPNFIPNVQKHYDNIIIIALSPPFLTFSPYAKRFILTKNKMHQFNIGSYTTSVLLETLFIKPNQYGITQEQLDQEFNSLKEKINDPKQECHFPRPKLYMTNTFQQIPFFFRKEPTTLESFFTTIDSINHFIPSDSEPEEKYSKDSIEQYLRRPSPDIDLTSYSDILDDGDDDDDLKLIKGATYIKYYGIVYQNTEDKAFYQKFCWFFSKELKKEGFPLFFPFIFPPHENRTENALFMANRIILLADKILPIKWRSSFQTGLAPFIDYLDKNEQKNWNNIAHCIETAAERMKQYIEKHPIPFIGPSDQIDF